METAKYIPPQKRAQPADFPNINEGTHRSSTTPSHVKKNHDWGREKSTAKSEWLLKDTTQEITSFHAAQLETGSTVVESNADSELLCTYNWISSKPSAIYVPGAPPVWTPKDLPVTLPMESGLYCPEQANYEPPKHPFEPLYQALTVVSPEIEFKSIDLVTNRRCLQMLFQFASGIAFQNSRIDLHMVHNTLFLTRRTPKTYFKANAQGTTKVGSNFESAFTTPEVGLEDSSSHHRIVRYPLGDLKCVVRFEADACCEEKETQEVMDQGCVNFFSPFEEEGIRAKCKQLSSTEPEAAAAAADKSDRTSVVLGGRIVPSSTMAELKTFQGKKFQGKKFCVDYHLAQLWFGRTSNLLVGTHDNGRFHKLEAIDVRRELLEWEKTHQEQLRKLAWLISELREIARRRPGGCCVLVCKANTKTATVYGAAKPTFVLPDYIVEKFWR